MTGWVKIESFLNARLVEREAECSTQGDTLAGRLGSLGVAVLSLHIEVVKALPLPRWLRDRWLKRIAAREFGDHPEFSEWWRS